MTESLSNLFEEALERYKAGESPKTLIPVFQKICNATPKNSPAWTCLSWLYLLTDNPKEALKAAKKSVKLTPSDPQGRVNLAIAMLEANEPGVRSHIEMVQKMIALSEEVQIELEKSIKDGFEKKPHWPSLQKVNNWLFSS